MSDSPEARTLATIPNEPAPAVPVVTADLIPVVVEQRLANLEQKIDALVSAGGRGGPDMADKISALMLDPARWSMVMDQAKVLAESGVIKGRPTPAAVAAIILHGLELGISPSKAAQNIELIDGELCIRGRLYLDLIYQRALPQGAKCQLMVDPRNDPEGAKGEAVWMMARPGGEEQEFRFGHVDATRAGLLGKKNYTKWAADMYVWRAFARGARTLFTDVCGGAYVREEIAHKIEGTPEHRAVVENEQLEQAVHKCKAILVECGKAWVAAGKGTEAQAPGYIRHMMSTAFRHETGDDKNTWEDLTLAQAKRMAEGLEVTLRSLREPPKKGYDDEQTTSPPNAQGDAEQT
jgi:hypothetical protein